MTTLASFKTALPPCCVRVHPNDSTLLVLGTYHLDKPSGKRTGSLDVYRADGTPIESHPTAAVLDIKFSPHSPTTLVSVHSTGNLMVWRCTHDNYDAILTLAENIELFSSETLITSVFFSPHKSSELLVTLTSGESAIVDLNSPGSYRTLPPHELECWTGAYGEFGLSNVVFTGGDDARLVAHDLRTPSPAWSTGFSHHQAGVVSILAPSEAWNSANPAHLWTGSYDDHLRVMDLRLVQGDIYPGMKPRVLHSENLNGGVWRLVPQKNSVLACCMYDGARIIEPEGEKFRVDTYYKGGHESMCYGGDWGGGGVVTCSFYDRVVEVWTNQHERSEC